MQKITLKQRNTFLTRYKKGEHVAKLAKDAGVSRVRFYAWIKKDALYRKELALQKKKLSPNKRQELIARVIDGEHISRLSKLYGISRKSIYKWLTRFQEAKKQNKPFAFENKKQFVTRYYRQAPHEYEQAVLDAVRKYPQLSSHRLPYVLPHIGERPILGNHGVQNILRRHNLQTYQKRLSYAEHYQESFIFSGVVGFIQDRLSHFLSGSTAYRERMATLGFLSFFFVIGIFMFYGSAGLVSSLPQSIWTWAMIFPLLSLAVGTIFFLYSIKYYLSIALVLSFSRHEKETGEKEKVSFWDALFGRQPSAKTETVQAMGLMEDISHVRLSRHPFVSIHLAMYNEKHVIERLLTAATSMHYDNYEVIVADDSTDVEAIAALEKWKHHPHVKIVHRETREGYKGKALANALNYTSKRAEFIVVFDADFIPYPDSITQFLKYFQSTVGSLSPRVIKESSIAAVQGYQWHVLNKSENWITRGVRSEYAGSYVVERSSIEVYGGLKQISGSVYMVRRDVVEKVGWGESITEDFEFTLRLYAQGFKVVYTPYVQAPAEAVSTLSRLIRQRMRWAEGHSQNVKRFFWNLVLSHKMTLPEKLEFVYLSPYYLQAAFFLFGTVCWFLSEAVFRVRLPFWTEVWGWSLILTNMIALPLVNLVGLFLEESDERDYLGLLSFIGLSYVIAPFQAYAAVKGFIENKEGPWFRTPKTGRITDTFTPGHFYRYVRAFFGKPAGVTVHASAQPYLALATAHNSFNKFKIHRKSGKWIGNTVLSGLLLLLSCLTALSPFVPVLQVAASPVGKVTTVDDIKKQTLVQKEEDITTPRTIRYQLPDGRVLEMIFHKEPRVRIKLDGKELDITTQFVGSIPATPKRSIIIADREVRYEEIVPHVDLVYAIKPSGFSEQFVVKQNVSLRSVLQHIDTDNITVISPSQDDFGFFDTNHKEVFTFGKPYLYEQDNNQQAHAGVGYSLSKDIVSGYTLTKNLSASAQEWLQSPNRMYPVVLDPSVVVAGVVANDVKFGGNQRKIAYVNGAWYVVREIGSTSSSDLGEINYYKSTDGTNWNAGVSMDTSSACAGQRSGPSLWVSGNLIYVVWNTRNCSSTTEDDRVEFRSINTASSDALGTKCYSADGGTYSGANVNAIAVAGSTVYVTNANDPDLYKVTSTTTCTNGTNWTSITTNSGVSAASQPVFDSDGTNLYVLSQSTGVKFNRYTGSAWGTALTLSASTSTNLTMLNDGTTIWELNGNAGTTTEFRKCTLSTTCLSAGNWTTLTAPWTGVTGIDSMSLTLDSTNNRLYAMIMYGGAGTQQVFFKDTDKTTISWGSEYNFGWVAADMSDVSSPYSSAGTAGIGVVARNGTNYEFATLPEQLWILLLGVPLLPKFMKKLRERRKSHG